MNADCMLRSMSKALNYSRPEEITENFFLSNDDVLTHQLLKYYGKRDLHIYTCLEK